MVWRLMGLWRGLKCFGRGSEIYKENKLCWIKTRNTIFLFKGVAFCFQSAFHRGRECNHYHPNPQSLLSCSFSPLFIAVGSVTGTTGNCYRNGLNFQSAFHRGRECNIVTRTTPSLSLLYFQSAFHRGRECNSIKRKGTLATSCFQSAFHRGRECNLEHLHPHHLATETFSPLFIAVGSVTQKRG